MARVADRLIASKPLIAVIVAALLIGAGPFSTGRAGADELVSRSLTMSNSQAGVGGVSYELRITYASSSNVGSVLIQFCLEGPLPSTPCTGPVGLDTGGVSLSSQTGETGFAVFGGSPANEILLTRPSGPVVTGTVGTYEFTGMQNPSNEGQFYSRVTTFASSDASGPSVDFGGLASDIDESPTVSAEVPPFLLFCLGESIAGLDCGTATEPFSDIGTLGPLVTGAAQTQLLAATNGDGGYSMWVIGGTMTSGNNTLPAMAGGPSQRGVSQFGINLRANTAPVVGQEVSGPGSAVVDPAYAQQNQFRYQSGDTIATVSAPDDFRKYTVSYIVNVDPNQPGGVYATTLTYIALANF